jgi:bifunctional UDP-N-acetylglucosamine pyrophosphorylase/glucosamine-1-phosphate N-acetyltransferase
MFTVDKFTAVIFAAGRGTRMLPLSETRPKPLQEVSGKNLIEWKLEALPRIVHEIVIVIGYQGEQIKQHFGDVWNGRRIRYVVQTELNGTAGALWAARALLSGRFLVMMGDDLYGREDVSSMFTHEFAVCVQEVSDREIGGEMMLNPDGTFISILEQKHHVEKGLVNTGLYMLDDRIFNYEPVPIGGSNTELGLPHTLAVLAQTIPVSVVKATKWFQISTPADLERAEKEFVV